jgi:hypothetical protein
LQSLASWLLALASRSEPRLRVRWGKRTGEPSVAGAQGGGPRQWVPGSAQSSEEPCACNIADPGPSGTGKEDPLNPVRPSPARPDEGPPRRVTGPHPRRRSSPVTVDTMCGQQVGAEHRKQHDFKVTPVMPRTRMRGKAREGIRKHWGRLLTQRSLARPKLRLLCATQVATLARVDTRCIAVGRIAGHVPRATPRSRLRSKMSQGRNGPAAGQGLPRRHRRQDRALAAARRLVNKSSDRIHRASPLRARLHHC